MLRNFNYYKPSLPSKIIFSSVLFVLLCLMVYDLINPVGYRGVVTAARNIPRYSRGLLMLFMFGYCFIYNYYLDSSFSQIYFIIFLMLILSICYEMLFDLNYYINLLKVLYSFISYYFFYMFFRNNCSLLFMKYLKWFSLVSIAILIIHIISSRLGIISSGDRIMGFNSSYILVAIFPFLFMYKSFKYRNIVLILIFLAVLLAIKRGAIIAYIFSMVGILFLDAKLDRRNELSKFVKLFLVVVSLLGISFLLYLQFPDVFNERVQDLSDKDSIGSGRGGMYSIILNDWIESSSIISIVFGKGYYSVQKLFEYQYGHGLMAHSDVFNFLHSYGIFGISLLSGFLLEMQKMIRKLYRIRHFLLLPYFAITVIFIFKMIYAGNFENPASVYLFIAFGIINGIIQSELISFNYENKIKI